MELINNTPFPSKFYSFVINETEKSATPIVRVTFDLRSNKPITEKGQSWPVSMKPWTCRYGTIPSDGVFRKDGVDVAVLGDAMELNGRPTRAINVSVNIAGKLNHRITVFGNRQWVRKKIELSISDPKPFTSLPLTESLAYGGFGIWDGLEVPYPKNIHGKGYLIEEQYVENSFLPNIENPNDLITTWKDQPNPVGIGMCNADGLKAEKYVAYNTEKKDLEINYRLFNQSFPSMIVDDLNTGEEIVVKGVSKDGVFKATVPKLTLFMKVKIGDKKLEKEMQYDQIVLLPNEKKLFMTYRAPFKYEIEPLEKRTCEIFST